MSPSFVPAGLGVQERPLLLLGHMLGVDPQTSMSLALVKRAREILFGVPALLSWQWLELHRWRRARPRRRPTRARRRCPELPWPPASRRPATQVGRRSGVGGLLGVVVDQVFLTRPSTPLRATMSANRLR